jgi:glycosyltransferase involved in cell wall biosynthesis
LRIAVMAPLAESVPPKLYGGTERVVWLITEELVRRGHDVTLFASGDSQTTATLVPICPTGLRLDPEVKDYAAYTLVALSEAYSLAQEFDILHNHTDYLAFGMARLTDTPTVTTTHGRLDLQEVRRFYRLFPEQRLVSISHDQRKWLPEANWVGTVHNGIAIDHFHLRKTPGDYLVFLGRISPEKRPDRAIEIARDVGMKLVIAAKVDSVDQAYYDAAIAPLIRANSGLIEYIGEVNEHEKDEVLGNAYAYLFPIDWPEPFGLTMVEAMATGTPVIASRNGSVPEIVRDGETGFVCGAEGGLARSRRLPPPRGMDLYAVSHGGWLRAGLPARTGRGICGGRRRGRAGGVAGEPGGCRRAGLRAYQWPDRQRWLAGCGGTRRAEPRSGPQA